MKGCVLGTMQSTSITVLSQNDWYSVLMAGLSVTPSHLIGLLVPPLQETSRATPLNLRIQLSMGRQKVKIIVQLLNGDDDQQ